MNIEVFDDADAVARTGAAFIAAQARAAVSDRGRFVFAVSGGKTPWIMLRALAAEDVPWSKVYLFQVDERIAPAGHADRNLTHLQESLLTRVRLDGRVHAMPVEASDLQQAAKQYAQALEALAGTPPVLDLIHLGLGPDGHTASLIPGDPVLSVTNADVALTGIYQGRQRMTLTYPVINRARQLLWLVTGPDKAAPLHRLRESDPSIPAGRVRNDQSLILADQTAEGDDTAPNLCPKD